MDLQISYWGSHEAFFKLDYLNEVITYTRYTNYGSLSEKSEYPIEQIDYDNWIDLTNVNDDDIIKFVSIQESCCLPLVFLFDIQKDLEKNKWYLETKMFPRAKFYQRKN